MSYLRPFLVFAAPALVAACEPADLPRSSAERGPLLFTEPPSREGFAPTVGRFYLDPSTDRDPLLVLGHVTEAMASRFAEGELPPSLVDRAVPSIVFHDDRALVLAPTSPLDEGARITLLAGSPIRPIELAVATPAGPLLARAWPHEGHAATASYALYCSDHPLGEADVPITLAPSGRTGRLRSGLATGAPGDRCLRFRADTSEEADAVPSVPPPEVALPIGVVRLDPKPFVRDTDRPPIAALTCSEGEVAFGPGCARLGDDRILVRSPPRFWSITGAGDERLAALDAPGSFTLTGLTPLTFYALDITTADAAGSTERTTLSFTTLGPWPHVILNEALFDPLGPEPAQEWIEIVNDGLAPADLGSYLLIDGSGEATALPSMWLAPFAFALIAGESFSAEGVIDVAPPSEIPIVRVPKLGLSNAGEPLALEGGLWPSRLPPLVHPAPGKSVARLDPKAPDDDPASFTRASPTPGLPNTVEREGGARTSRR